MANKNPQQKGLDDYRKAKRIETANKIEEAILYLKKHRKPVNINSVSAQSGVSSVTIYKYPELVEKIKGTKTSIKERKPEGNAQSVARMQVIIDGLKLKNDELLKENEQLKRRIEIQNGEIYELRRNQKQYINYD